VKAVIKVFSFNPFFVYSIFRKNRSGSVVLWRRRCYESLF